ncbi:MAG: flagellin [Halieaceae bacterium]|jgi:flagellin
MPQIINTNIPSLNAQRNLNSSQNDVSTALQRLSSGLRINSAKDDAAGLAISERFTAQIRGLNQAARNASDGISLAQTAEGDLAEITNNLQRIRELSVQSANATNSSSDRLALQEEVSQLIAEIDRVAVQSNFNGVNLLDGSFSAQAFQVGANAGQTITVDDFASARTSSLGQTFEATTGSGAAPSLANFIAGDLLVNGVDVGAVTDASGTGATGSFAETIGNAISAADAQVNVAVGASTLDLGAFTLIDTAAAAAGATYSLVVEGVTIISETGIDDGTANTVTALEVQSAIDLGTTQDALAAVGVTVSGTVAGGNLTFTKIDGSNLDTTELLDDGAGAFSANVGFANVSGAAVVDTTVTEYGELTLTSSADIVIGGNLPASAGLATGTSAVPALGTGTTVAGTDISTVDGANAAIVSVDAALASVNSSRASLGAIQNRFDSVVTSLQITAENLSASRSRIQDTDFAAETANLTRAQILQQAGIAILAQANAQPQNVLALLQ